MFIFSVVLQSYGYTVASFPVFPAPAFLRCNWSEYEGKAWERGYEWGTVNQERTSRRTCSYMQQHQVYNGKAWKRAYKYTHDVL